MTAIRQTWILARRTMTRFARSPELVASSVAFPLLLLVIQLVVFGKLVQKLDGSTYIDRVVPAVMLATAIFSLPVNAAGFQSDLRDGILSRFRSMPISRSAFVAGRVAGDTARVAVTAACLLAVAVPLGFSFTMSVPSVLGFAGVFLLGALMFSWMAVFAGAVSPSAEAVHSTFGPLVLLAYFWSSGFIPVTAFPGVLQPVVRANPVSAVQSAMMNLSQGGGLVRPVAYAVCSTTGLSLVFAVAARRAFGGPEGRPEESAAPGGAKLGEGRSA
jgi:ABC-2 type transport system permease protein